MKLIDVLVDAGDAIPLFGVHTKYLAMDPDGRVHGYCEMPSPTALGWGVPDALYSTDGRGCLIQIDRDDVDGQWQSAIITREQYEVALAAKNECWIEWRGGECPVEKGALVDVKLRNGRTATRQTALEKGDFASYAFWRCDGNGADIIAYRLHQPQEVNHFEGAPGWAKLRVRHKEDKDEYFIESTETVRYQAIGIKIGNPITFSTEFWDVVATRNLCGEQPEVDEACFNESIGQGPVTVWNGEGLPPVGCELQYRKHKKADVSEWFNGEVKYASEFTVVIQADCYPGETVGHPANFEFRPIISEAERKRDEAVQALCNAGGGNGKVDEKAGYGSCWFDVYDAIAAGEIPGVKLEV